MTTRQLMIEALAWGLWTLHVLTWGALVATAATLALVPLDGTVSPALAGTFITVTLIAAGGLRLVVP